MKKILILIFSLILTVNLTGCSDKNSQSDSEPYVYSKDIIEALPFPDIKLSIPNDYETTSSEHIDEYYKKGNASVIVTSKPINASDAQLDNIVYDAKFEYQNITDTLKEVSSENCKINGHESKIIEIVYSIVSDTNTMSQGSCIGFIIGKNNLYIITCSAPMNEYSDFSEEFKNIIKSAMPLD